MVQPNVFSAAFVLNALSMVAAAPSEQNQGTVSFAHLTQEEARELAIQNNETRRAAGLDDELVDRDIPSFGAYFADWDFQGASFYHRANIDGRGYYIGDDWNDRISSIWNYDYDKECSYWTEYSWDDGGYCFGEGIILDGRTNYARLYDPFNDSISCRLCKWS